MGEWPEGIWIWRIPGEGQDWHFQLKQSQRHILKSQQTSIPQESMLAWCVFF